MSSRRVAENSQKTPSTVSWGRVLASHSLSGHVGTPTRNGYLINMVKPYDFVRNSGSDGRLFDRPGYFKFMWLHQILANEEYHN
jgi:hypothetical protein